MPVSTYAPAITRVVCGTVVVASIAAAIVVAPHRQTKFTVDAAPQPVAAAATQSLAVAPPVAGPKPGAPQPGTAAPVPTSIPLGTSGAAAAVPGLAAGPSVPLTGPGLASGSDPLTSDWQAQTKCSQGWPAPAADQQGGLSSLITLAPMAGSFMSEAFALGSAYQPVLSIAGPLLAEIAPIIAANMSWIQPIINQVQGVTAVVLQAILPFYGPYRQQFLNAEGEVAKQITPVLQSWASSDAAVCFVSWEATQIRRAKGGAVHTVSLSQPWTSISYGPQRAVPSPILR